MNYSNLYESETIMVKLEMHVFARAGDFVLAQYEMDPHKAEAFIYNVVEDKCYGRYSSIGDDPCLLDDWHEVMIGDESDE